MVGLIFGMGLAAALFVATWGRISSKSTRLGRRASSALAVVLLLLLGYLEVWCEGLDPRLEFYPIFPDFLMGWYQLESRSGPKGSCVAYAGTDLPYYLMGNGLRNEVRYVNVDRHRDWLLHDYHREALRRGRGNWPNSRPGWDRIEPDFPAWVANLEAAEIQLLVVTRVNPAEGMHNIADADNFPIERRWADSHPERFEPLYGAAENDPWFRLYRFRRSRSDGPRGVNSLGDG